jgi:dCMP deaminase
MKNKFIQSHLKAAEVYAKLSSAHRLKVGCVIVKNDTIIGIGYNGMPAGWDNNCEDKRYDSGAGGWISPEEFYEQYPYKEMHGEFQDQEVRYGLKTKPEVLHAESNAIAKVAKSTNSSEGAAMFITHAPCIDCSKLIHQAGISSVYYRNTYRSEEGLQFLEKCGVKTELVWNPNT